VPIIVALNKIDRPDANPDYVKKQLAEAGLVPDEWDGDTMVVPVSAKQKKGLEDLMEAILLVADNADIRANPNGKCIGTVIESQVEKGRGTIATLLVQNGTLQMGDAIVAGTACGRIKAMFDFRGKRVLKAKPSTPIQIMGLRDVPAAGDVFQVYPSEKEAKAIVEDRKLKAQAAISAIPKISLEELFDRFKAGEIQELRLIVKADVQGSLEPIRNSLNDLSKGDIKINILYAETGNVTENDVSLASASHAIVVGFNVQAEAPARRMAEAERVSIRLYDIIYRLTEDIEKALKGMLEPEFREVFVGRAQILAVFKVSKVGNIAGCRVLEGELRRNGKARVRRGDQVMYDGEISSLKHEKDDVREVRTGFECGISFKGFSEMAVGDVVECYAIERM
jgi:translation initiation factor IF-2